MSPPDRHDDAIRDLVAQGVPARRIAIRLHRYAGDVRDRIAALGLREAMLRNARAAARNNGATNCRRVQARMRRPGGDGGQAAACAILVRRLRASAPPPGDNAHLAACLHARGLTLAELDAHLGVPPAAAIAAIRQQAGQRP